jgi:hypothetical protein
MLVSSLVIERTRVAAMCLAVPGRRQAKQDRFSQVGGLMIAVLGSGTALSAADEPETAIMRQALRQL